MPILRYFLFVGGTLLALLFLTDTMLPSVPLPASLRSASDLPAVRIRSDRKWPERIVMDTTIVTPAPVRIAKVEQPAPASSEQSARSAARDAFAKMTVADARPQPVVTKAAEKAPVSAAKFTEAVSKPADVKKRKVAKVHPGRPIILVAQQPHFGFFDSTW